MSWLLKKYLLAKNNFRIMKRDGTDIVLCSVKRVESANTMSSSSSIVTKPPSWLTASSLSLSPKEYCIIKSVHAECSGGFVQLLPSAEIWKRYGCFLGKRNKRFHKSFTLQW